MARTAVPPNLCLIGGTLWSRMRGLRLLLFCLLIGLSMAAPAHAAITASSISSPGNPAELFYNGDQGSGSVTVRGSVSTDRSNPSTGDLLCYWNLTSHVTPSHDVLAQGINVSSGRFAVDVSLLPIHGQVCRLAFVPSGTVPTGSALTPYRGPVLSVSQQFSLSSNGSLYGYDILAGTSKWSFQFDSMGLCPIAESFATDSSSLGSWSLFGGSACLYGASGIAPEEFTRSAIQIDGLNAYPAGAIVNLTGDAGFSPISYSATYNASHTTVTITEVDPLMICNAPGGFRPNPTTCPGLHSAGVAVVQTTQLTNGGQVARVQQRFVDTDRRRHALDLLFNQTVEAPQSGEAPGFEFPGQTSYATHGEPDSFSSFPRGPGSIIVIGDPVETPEDFNPIGTITYGTPPASANFTSPDDSRFAGFLMHYTDRLGASQSVTYRWSYVQAGSFNKMADLANSERDRYTAPRVSITRPRNGETTGSRVASVVGRASDPVKLRSVTVNGVRARVKGKTYTASVTLHPGANVIRAIATNVGGNSAAAEVRVTYKPKECVVPAVVGSKLGDAEAALRHANCAVGRIRRTHSNTVAVGRVISVSPAAHTHHPSGTKVALVVSGSTSRHGK
jgi:Glucodextranase, domain B/PASTA domain